MANKKVISLDNLTTYNTKMTALAEALASAALQSAKDYTDTEITSAGENYDPAGTAASLVNSLSEGQVATNAAAIEVLNGTEEIEGSVAYQIASAVADLAQKVMMTQN